MIAIWSESLHLCGKSVEIGYDICLTPKLNTCRSDCARMNTCVKFLRVVNTSLSIMKFIFFLFIFLSKKKIPMASGTFFLHHAFPSLYNINFMVCLIMWACSFRGKLLCIYSIWMDRNHICQSKSLCGFSFCQCCWTSLLHLLYFSTSWCLSLIWYREQFSLQFARWFLSVQACNGLWVCSLVYF